jgi:pimeloyl-ACP methyl ester carboxylesterase
VQEPQTSGATVVPTSAGLRVRDLRLRSGLRLAYTERGPRLGPAVIMLHGYTDSWFSFSRVLPLISRDQRVIAVDQRGHGESEVPANGYSIDHLAADVVQLMDALRIPSATIVGHSMGSFVARRIAERASTRVTRLVLIGSACTARNSVLKALAESVSHLTDPVNDVFVREFQRGTIYRPVPSGFMARVVDDSRRVPSRVWKGALAGMMDYVPSAFPIGCPALVVGGDQDAVFTKAEQEGLVRLIPGADVRILSGIGHALHWEDPEAFVALMRS